MDGRQRTPLRVDKDEITIPTKAQIDQDLAKMRSMTPQEAAIAAAQAVEEAEIAMAEAEEAAREAEAAEADAEAAQAFAEAAMKTLKARNNQKMVKLVLLLDTYVVFLDHFSLLHCMRWFSSS